MTISDRLRLLSYYERSRLSRLQFSMCRLSPAQWNQAMAWVHGFEKFMCVPGWDNDAEPEREEVGGSSIHDAQQHDPGVQSPGPPVDTRVFTMDAVA